ncbi:MAG: sigma-70 family RNA polymerase sigma factor [Clostridia bacterium]|nr:sigma-70 family RNA polymerase sigma factor [Clostridia bacterium]
MIESEKKRPYDENLDLLRAYREGHRQAGERLAELNMPLVYSIASRFSGRGADMSDLIECGSIGLVKAMRTFDFSHGCAFSTYAVPLIFGEMRRFLRDDGIIKVSREERRLAGLLSAERERRLAAGEEADIASVARAVGISPQDAASAIFSSVPPRSLDEQAYDDDDTTTLGSIICDEEESERTFDKFALRQAIDKLEGEQKKLIILRYFRDMSQTEVAKIMGVTQVKISREEKKIISRLRQLMS